MDARLWVYGALVPFVAAAAWTDVRAGKVYNRLTGPGVLLGLALNSFLPAPGGIGLDGALLGMLCGAGPLLLAYLAGYIGGGDVKIMAVVGAFLGPTPALHVLLYAFVVGAALAVVLIVAREGMSGLARRILQRSPTPPPVSPEEGPPADGARPEIRVPFAVGVAVGTAWHYLDLLRGGGLLDLLRPPAA